MGLIKHIFLAVAAQFYYVVLYELGVRCAKTVTETVNENRSTHEEVIAAARGGHVINTSDLDGGSS